MKLLKYIPLVLIFTLYSSNAFSLELVTGSGTSSTLEHAFKINTVVNNNFLNIVFPILIFFILKTRITVLKFMKNK